MTQSPLFLLRDGANKPEDWGIAEVVSGLRRQRQSWRKQHDRSSDIAQAEFPSRAALTTVCTTLCGVLFPLRLGPHGLRRKDEDAWIGTALKTQLAVLEEQIRLELQLATPAAGLFSQPMRTHAHTLARDFAQELPALRALLDQDVEAAWRGDPAAISVDEVLLCYPGVLAVIHHRLAHALYRRGVRLVARMIAEIAHGLTGIDIHPGATIGPGFFIDHGTGVVIGETAIIGANVRLYQAVTLGAKRFREDSNGQLVKGEPRHPIIEDDVVIYAGATLLGRITIGRGASIGGGVWLTQSVPPYSQVTQGGVQYTYAGEGI